LHEESTLLDAHQQPLEADPKRPSGVDLVSASKQSLWDHDAESFEDAVDVACRAPVLLDPACRKSGRRARPRKREIFQIGSPTIVSIDAVRRNFQPASKSIARKGEVNRTS
jgi:hypothetical protein